MLNPAAIQEIERATADYPQRSGAAIDALKIVQRHNGWISDEDLRATAELLQMSADELEGIATFYSQLFRRPVGRHVIQVCDGIVCWMLDKHKLVARLEQHGIAYGKTSDDGRFTLLLTPCLGACHRAPAMLIDGQLHEGFTLEGVEAILARYP